METIQAVPAANDTAPARVLSAQFAERLAAINRASRVLRTVGLLIASTHVALDRTCPRIELAIAADDHESRKTAAFQICGGVTRVTQDGVRYASGFVMGVQIVWEEPLIGAAAPAPAPMERDA